MGIFPIEWQQENRTLLNQAIKVYNTYVSNESNNLNEVIRLIKYVERKLKDQPENYMDDIEQIKENLDIIVSKRM